jgi:hypothetical protein
MSGFLLICMIAIVAGGLGYWLQRRSKGLTYEIE